MKVQEVNKAVITKAVRVSNSEALVSSDFIAKVFEKRHDNVLRDIENMEINLLKIEENPKKFFKNSSYVDSKNRTYKRYELTRKGFDLIALSFTGEKALKYKLWFIDEFHEKETSITKLRAKITVNKESDMWVELRGESKQARKALTEAINDYELPQRIAENKPHARFVATRIMNYTQLIYKILDINLGAGVSPRDVLKPRKLFELEDMEYSVAKMIKELTEVNKCHYKQTYQQIKKSLS